MRSALEDKELLARLIAFDSVSDKSNRPLANAISDYAKRPGVAVEHLADDSGEKVNVLIHAGPPVGVERGGLVISGHMDVVPANEPQWRSDPFAMVERDDVLFGRGVADMKGFLALALNVLRVIDIDSLTEPLVFLLTRDEEIGTRGAEEWVNSWPEDRLLPRAAIIGEPTGLDVVRMHKGHAWLRITLVGKSAHSGYPHLGKSAISLAGAAIVALDALGQELKAERHPSSEHFEVPFVPLNIGTIDGGAAVNVVPDRCVLNVGLRPLPGVQTGAIVQRIRHSLSLAIEGFGDPGGPHHLELLGDSPPMEVAADAPIHRHLCQLIGQQKTHSASFATDAGWFQKLGLDCVIWGPGSIEVAHRPNESIALEELARAKTLLERVVSDHCQDKSA